MSQYQSIVHVWIQLPLGVHPQVVRLVFGARSTSIWPPSRKGIQGQLSVLRSRYSRSKGISVMISTGTTTPVVTADVGRLRVYGRKPLTK